MLARLQGYKLCFLISLRFMRIQPHRLLFAFLLLCCCSLLWPQCAVAQEQVLLQLKWTHAFQFAGYYAALERGYYREAGLNVQIREGSPGISVTTEVVSDQAQYGIGNSGLLLDRAVGQPVVALAVIFQHSPLVLITRDDSQTAHPASVHDLINKRIMIEPQSDEVLTYLRREGIDPARLQQIDHTFNPIDLIEGRVDAMTAYVSNEPYVLNQHGLKYQIHTPRAVGIDFYADNLFTSEQELRRRPDRVRAFRDASLRGWQYAMQHPDEVIELIRARYAPQTERRHLEFEMQQMRALIRADLIEIGYMHPGRWRHMADVYAESGALPQGFSLDGFLYNPHLQTDEPGWLQFSLALVLLILASVSGLALWIHGVNRRLAQSVAESQQVRQELAQREQQFRLLAENATDVIWTLDLDGRCTYVSPSIERLRGYTPEQAQQQTLEQSFTAESAAVIRAQLDYGLQAVQRGERFTVFVCELEQPCQDGSTIWTDVTLSGLYGPQQELIGVLGVTRDISERKEAQDRIRHLAHHDALTDLPNRTLFTDRLEHALALARRHHERLALLFIDIDRFKQINDLHGHAVGDLVLQQAAERMLQCVRESDTVGRISGDEFMVLLPEIGNARNAVALGHKLVAALDEPIEGLDLVPPLRISASIGIALYPDHGQDADTLRRHADLAMYQAKQRGRHGVELYEIPRPMPVRPVSAG